MSDQIREHLEFFGELGVDGVRREAEWSKRSADVAQPFGTAENVAQPFRAAENVAQPFRAAENVVQPFRAAEGAAESPVAQPFRAAEAVVQIARSEEEVMRAIRDDIGDCMRCKLHGMGRTQIVFGVGNPSADLMFVGEAPGADEDIQGEPFVGRAGQLLTKIIEAIGMTRQDVYIANVLKCRPPGNRNPEPDEVVQCEPFLLRQIDTVKPKVIVALGKFAAQCLLKTNEPITRLRGREYKYRDAILMPTYHPAYLLRTPSAKREVWEDMKRVRAILQENA